MKFIVDAQLPKSLSDFLKTAGYDSVHTLELHDADYAHHLSNKSDCTKFSFDYIRKRFTCKSKGG